MVRTKPRVVDSIDVAAVNVMLAGSRSVYLHETEDRLQVQDVCYLAGHTLEGLSTAEVARRVLSATGDPDALHFLSSFYGPGF